MCEQKICQFLSITITNWITYERGDRVAKELKVFIHGNQLKTKNS